MVVALGDSFSAGEGAPRFDAGTDVRDNSCHRSSKAWPALLAKRRKAAFVSFACSGAEIVDVLDGTPRSPEPERTVAQLDRLRGVASVDLVTLTIGGNDAGFAKVLVRCAIPTVHCERYYRPGGRHDLTKDVKALGARLRAVYRAVRRAAPQADLLVLGYPRLFPLTPARRTCVPSPAVSTIDAIEIYFLNDLARQLRAVVRRAARARGARFVDAQDAFDGHEMRCGKDPLRMVNMASLEILNRRYKYFFHPTAHGYRRLAKLATPAWR
jgi:lysophospholipase L1-like esterase